jgi:VanZ family protein
MTRRDSQQLARWLLGMVTFLIVYGSLYPFRFAATGSGGLIELVAGLSWARTTRSDIAANILLYLPFGACLGWMLASRLGGPLAILAATATGVLLSTSIEVAQVFETRRVSSLTDVLCNGLGTLAGAALALALRSARHGFSRHPLTFLLTEPIATALLLLWIGYRLAPFALSLDPAQWRASLRPLAGGDWFAPGETLGYLMPWLVTGYALSVVGRGASPRRNLAIVMLGTLAGLVLVSGRSLVPAEIVAMVLALALSVPLASLSPSRAAALLAALLAVTIVIEGLTPFDFRVDPGVFGLVPFRDALTRYRATNLVELFQKCFLYGALVWLLARSGLSVLTSTLAGAGLVLAVELLQAWLPGKPADITDPLLAVVAGGLIAVFDAPPARSARLHLRP